MSESAAPIVELVTAQAADAEELVALRIVAMRDSLERVGRFDPVRARERFLSGFSPACTRHILVDGQRTGFVVVKPKEDHWLLDHLYLLPACQGRGIGGATLKQVFQEADAATMPLRVGALRESDANRFYRQHGFVQIAEEEWDIYYLRQAMQMR